MNIYIYIQYTTIIHQATHFSPQVRLGLMVATVQMNGTRIAHLQRQQQEGHLHGKLTSIHLRRGWRLGLQWWVS